MTDYAVILTHNRLPLLRQCLEAISPQVDHVIIIDNASDPPVRVPDLPGFDNFVIIQDPMQPPNLARMWNHALDLIAKMQRRVRGDETWNVALLCDDSIVPPGWFKNVSAALRRTGAGAASTHSYEPAPIEYTLTQLSNGPDRMCPWGFILPGEKNLRADEDLHWWYCDTDIDWRARQDGGTVITTGECVVNVKVGDFTAHRPELTRQAEIDGKTFWTKWQTIVKQQQEQGRL